MLLFAQISNAPPSQEFTLLWIWGALSLVIAASVGFFAGLTYGRGEHHRTLIRAGKNLQKVFQAVSASLETATEACRLMDGLSLLISEQQARSLENQRHGLVSSLDGILNRFRQSVTPPVDKPVPFPGEQDSPYQWQQEPQDRLTGLPDHEACHSNLDVLLNWSRQHSRPSSLLFVRIDKFEGLRERYGITDSQQLIKRLSAILCRSVRDQDLVCRSSCDTFAIYMPGLEREAAEKFSVTLRNNVSNSRFQLSDLGPDVLLTVSLGFTPCLESDTSDSAWSRAQEALARSQRLGRNQLHLHDGAALVHCTVE